MTATQDGEIRAELARVLESQGFSQSQRHREFLRYIVEEALAGRGDRIKGYTVAVEVFGKPADFDAQNDPYVRVEAGRLRNRLAEYYLAEGATNPIRIKLRKGAYKPKFTASDATGTLTEPRQVHGGYWSRPSHWVAVAAISIAVAVLYIVVQPDSATPANSPPEAGYPRVAVDNFANIGTEEFDYFAAGLTEEILVLFNRFQPIIGSISVFHEEDLSRLAVSQLPDFLLSGTVAMIDDSIRVTTSIADARTGRQIWSEAFNESTASGTLFEIQDRIAADIVNIARDPLGPILMAGIDLTLAEEQFTRSDPALCYLLFESARSLAPAARRRAEACYAPFVEAQSLDAAGWAVVSLLNYWAFEDGADLLEGSGTSIERAYDAAQRALDIDGNGAAAHLALAYVQLGRQRLGDVLDSIDSFFSLSPPLSTRVAAEGLLLRIGAADSVDAFDEALVRTPKVSPYMFVAPALYSVGLGEYQTALEWAEKIDAPGYTMAQVLWAALAAQVGQADRARRHVGNILAMHPDFATYGLELIQRWSADTKVVQGIVDGLELAGIELSAR